MDVMRQTNHEFWLNQVFAAKAVASRGVVRRSRAWVETEIGLD